MFDTYATLYWRGEPDFFLPDTVWLVFCSARVIDPSCSRLAGPPEGSISSGPELEELGEKKPGSNRLRQKKTAAGHPADEARRVPGPI
ncbi:hypothetical protein MPNT_80076 [Candidatus Methylacidithermus pantelleriae]|uniref:Uncharacterized protein n=1 Tax=Candidatus Methylacidithermus pantelleriae TaxID=2744239 RepID=A0A8J2BM68_9BACT|nr:hypothetical protein MPNT_80076 [Candidatus Methylacidithermus pantelleriae]